MSIGNTPERQESERLDKWLWAARFFKTRSLASESVERGKVDVNGDRAKKARGVIPGDVITVRKGPFATTVVVKALAARRGSAALAAAMYEETKESRNAREVVSAHLASMPIRDAGAGRPSKKDRRELNRLREDRD